MKRRDFLNVGLLSALGGTLVSASIPCVNSPNKRKPVKGKAKNIIFLVSDGMSTGTLNMADLLSQRKYGRVTTWMQLYRDNRVSRALMDVASANSLITDSSAASSAWGGGVRVNNGALNISPDGVGHEPILSKFKKAGKSVGCVTTVPITHATPAGFCVSTKSRNDQEKIASLYLQNDFDILMGGGFEYFSKEKRKDGEDLFAAFKSKGYQVVQSKEEMNTALDLPLLGVFYTDGLPYSLDHQSDDQLKQKVPTLAEMTRKAIALMSRNNEGFVLQVEGGKVDWAAHANDGAALLYEQIAFDEAVAEAIAFAEKCDDTLVIITTDHGNSNPGLIKCNKVDEKFDTLHHFNQTNEWILQGIRKDNSVSKVIERVNYAQGITFSEEECKSILADYASLDNDGLYNSYKLPFRKFAEIQQRYTAIGWSGMDHSADYVELAMFGPGSEALNPFVKNTDIHNFMLKSAGVEVNS